MWVAQGKAGPSWVGLAWVCVPELEALLMPDHLRPEYIISKQNLHGPPHRACIPTAPVARRPPIPVAVATSPECLALPRPCLETNKLAFDDRKGVEF